MVYPLETFSIINHHKRKLLAYVNYLKEEGNLSRRVETSRPLNQKER